MDFFVQFGPGDFGLVYCSLAAESRERLKREMPACEGRAVCEVLWFLRDPFGLTIQYWRGETTSLVKIRKISNLSIFVKK
jgi:hypothetical protein